MADLTPPSSKPNTPLRPVETRAPGSSSPSSLPGTSASAPLVSSSTAHGDAKESDIEMNQLDDEDSESVSEIDEDGDGAAISGGDEVMSEGSEDEAISGPAGENSDVQPGEPAGEASLRLKLKNVLRGKSKKDGDRRQAAKRQRSRKGKTKELADPVVAGRKGKDGDLYESHIVAGWNKDFGDVVAQRQLQTQSQSHSQHPVASASA